MFNFIFTLLFSLSVFSQVQKIDGLYASNLSADTNYIKNSSCNKNATYHVATGTTVSKASFDLENGYSCSSAGGASGLVKIAAYPIDKKYSGDNCMYSFKYVNTAGSWKTNIELNGVDILTSDVTLDTSASVTDIKTFKAYISCAVGSSNVYNVKLKSTAANLIYYSDVKLQKADSVGASSNISATSFTPTISGFGTVSNLQAFYSRQYDQLEVWGSFTSGTSTATIGSISLPSINISIDSNKVLSSIYRTQVGTLIRAISATTTSMPTSTVGPYVIAVDIPTSSTAVYIATQTNTTGATFPLASGNGVANINDHVQFRFKVPISGWSATENSINSKCPNDIACENEASANVSSTAVVTNETLDIISSCTGASASGITCTYNSGIYTVAPQVYVTQNCTSFGGGTVDVINQTLTTFTYRLLQGTGGAGVTCDASVSIRKSGADFKARQNIQGFLSDHTVSSISNSRIEYVKFGGPSSTNCTTTPCTIAFSSPSVSSVTRSAAGTYSVNFLSGTWANTNYMCTGSCIKQGATQDCIPSTNATSATAMGIVSVVTGAASDAEIQLQCVGTK